MQKKYNQIIETIRQKVERNETIIGASAGSGLSARCEEAGGADLIVIYNSGRFRMAGRGSLAGLMPYGNANEIVREMGNEILPIVKETPVLAGVCGTDPFCNLSLFLDELKAQGFAGIQNFPTVGLIDGKFRKNLEETGMGYALEVKLILLAHEKGMMTTPYVFNEKEAEAMAQAGADIIVVHLGLTIGGDISANTSYDLKSCIPIINACASAAKAIRNDIITLCHGGPILEPEDVAYIMAHCPNCHGFYGASSMERLPTEQAIKHTIQKFKEINRG
ncbi:phosphoenolpyruvate hydrolase family protein [Photorhabdus heterorhabditis]|uniref:Phosphoenolpyruvate hydrolase family protein n=1 Tax=Photorhabdus heterorhabditis TaxID=880156 RepID=A0A5B0VJF7_9GAMM|nr:phosphoenolpyruvate hydrolase family protein [Photorhabdus heterorhabditis]KAA1174061.1 phosphoenolpyruvate hydrolase family protein [Photorhabdus heterorhabditis]MBS9442652.1 phosphoenolpyruvate hydrolase family protein [Photorhabdus heterorhabditis]